MIMILSHIISTRGTQWVHGVPKVQSLTFLLTLGHTACKDTIKETGWNTEWEGREGDKNMVYFTCISVYIRMQSYKP